MWEKKEDDDKTNIKWDRNVVAICVIYGKAVSMREHAGKESIIIQSHKFQYT